MLDGTDGRIIRTYVLIHSANMSAPPILTAEQIDQMVAELERLRTVAAAAMYRTEDHEMPYRAGRGEMYRLWNMLGQAIETLERYRTDRCQVP